MEVEPIDDSRQSYTILRIKRKRNEEPLDALVVDSSTRRKKPRGGLNVFHFAETVEQETWDSAQQEKELRARITSLAQDDSPKDPNPSQRVAPTETPLSPIESPVRQSPIDGNRSYKVIMNANHPRLPAGRNPTAPPKILSAKDIAKPAFTMYDAVPSENASGPLDTSMENDPEMANFLPMLQEYLRVNDIDTSVAASSKKLEDGDYVWDVFYQRPTKFQILYEHANNIATLTGLPPSGEDLSDSDDDSSNEDEADEDSNAEDWYTNDYPDEESDDSETGSNDLFHDSPNSDDYNDDDGEHDWR